MVQTCYKCKRIIVEPKTLCLDCFEHYVYMVEINKAMKEKVEIFVKGVGNG